MHFNWQEFSDEYNMFMRDMREYAKMPVRTGGMTSFPGLFVYAVARRQKAFRILEVGTRNGISACTFARAMQENHGDGLLITCDVVDVLSGKARAVDDKNVFPLTPDKMIEAIGCGHIQTHFIVQRGADTLRECPDKSLDLILLDGSHKEDDVVEEVPLALSKLKSHGVLLLDDVYPYEQPLKYHAKVIPGPWLALKRLGIEFLRPDPDYSVAYIPKGE